MEPARLPNTLLKPKPRFLKELKPGEQMNIPFPNLKVDPELRCYLKMDAEETRIIITSIRVRRDEQGLFHVDIPDKIYYEPEELPNKAGLLQVASVTVVKRIE